MADIRGLNAGEPEGVSASMAPVRSLSYRTLQAVVAALGLIALGAGISTMIFGAASIVGAGEVSATIDSEMRFFSVWYAAAGIILLRSAPRVGSDATTIRAVGLALFVAGVTRVLSWIAVGRPHSWTVVLMTLELTLPVVLIRWQARVASRPSSGTEKLGSAQDQ